MNNSKTRKWIEYRVFKTVMMVYRGEYAIDNAQFVKIMKVSIPETDKILIKKADKKSMKLSIKQILN